MPAKRLAGKWLRIKSRPELGLGYCRRVSEGRVTLAFVDVPEVTEHEIHVLPEDVVERTIPVGTRLWVRGKPYGWHAGVIDAPNSDFRYYVSLVGHAQRLLLYQDQFVIRWSQPLRNPAQAVAHGLAETPQYYDARSALLSELVQQRRVARGLTAAISAPIHLFQHQLDTAARVLADPVMRYLLADEVGLGKTIEAGIVIRQLLLDSPDARILVLCPDTLHGQWVSELSDRLGLGAALRGPQLSVSPHASVGDFSVARRGSMRAYDLVVIDEAHNLFKHVGPGNPIEKELQEVDGLLALSATPMRGDIEAFRRLLAIVDPVAFSDASPESFRARLDERERSAGDVQVLATRRASLRQKSAVLASVEADFQDDENVQRLVNECRKSADPHAAEWGELAEYVREIYRVSRRMIRHRRTSELTDAYAVAGRIPTFVQIEDPARPVIDEFLETLRLRMSDNGSPAVFAMAVVRGLAGPRALRDHLRRPRSPDQQALFEMTAAQLDMAGLDARTLAAVDVAASRIAAGRRVVVASSYPLALQEFDKAFSELHDTDIHHHYRSMSPGDRDDAVADFLGEYDGGLLLADTSMEEGRNLQEAEVLINLDLPLDANRLDQRIGRLDRYAVRPEPAEVVVFTETASEWVTAHVELLSSGIGVLDNSVSTVQRLLSNVLDDIIKNLLRDGCDALRVDVDRLRDDLFIERDNIDLLEELESVEAATVFGDEPFEELLDYERDLAGLRSAVRRLTSGTGALALRPTESRNGVLSFGGGRSLGMSEYDSTELQALLEPKAFEREVALEQPNVLPFRAGDPLADWLQEYLVADERGRASAIVRPVPGLASPALWLHSEFLIEFNVDNGDHHDTAALRRLRRRGESHFRPMQTQVWTDPSGRAPQSLTESVLDLPYDSDRDEVLRGKIWAPVRAELPTWINLCEESAQAAWEEIRGQEDLASAVRAGLDTANSEAARRIGILEARASRLPSGAERQAAHDELDAERTAARALIWGIENPTIRMVACGACVLWPEENF